MAEHSSTVGGSSANRVINCPSSRLLNKHMPGQEWSEASARGTALHEVVEKCIKEGYLSPTKFIGHVIEQIEMTEELLDDKAVPAIAYFNKLLSDCEGISFSLEKRVGFDQLDDDDTWYIPGAFGTADVIFDDGEDRCGIIDWKFGDGVMVSAQDNDQMRFYLAGAIATGDLPEVETYEAHIFQPALSKTPEQYASVAYYTFEELEDFVELLKASVESEGFNVGSHCRFCNAKSACQAFMGQALENVETDIDGLDANRLSELVKMIPAIVSWTKDVKAAARRNAMNGIIIPGFKLDTTYGHRYYKDEKKASRYVQQKFGLSDSERTDKKLKSYSQIEKIVKRLMSQEGSEITPDMLAEFEHKHVDRPEFEDSLVECAPGEEGVSKDDIRRAMKRISNAS